MMEKNEAKLILSMISMCESEGWFEYPKDIPEDTLEKLCLKLLQVIPEEMKEHDYIEEIKKAITGKTGLIGASGP
jgi:hypothetical protein